MLNECTKKAPVAATTDVIENSDNKFSTDNYITLNELTKLRKQIANQLLDEPFNVRLTLQHMVVNRQISEIIWG